MQLRWTEESANDLERIADYLAGPHARTGPRTDSLHLQRPGFAPHLPNRGGVIFVVRILHGAQQWP
jgi:plasmid stabilization system protein ParE